MSSLQLASIVVDRRKVACAFFTGLELKNVSIHTLPSEPGAAQTSLAVFLRRTLERHPPQYVSLEHPEEGWSDRIATLTALTRQVLREAAVPLVEVPLPELLNAYSLPPVERRQHLRSIARRIWPSLYTRIASTCGVDAAALGLHVQIERTFAHAEAQR